MTQRMARLEEDVHEIRGALTEQREVIDAMARDFSKFSTWVTTGLGRMMDRVGFSYTSYSQTHMSYQRRVKQRTREASTSTAQQDQQQPDLCSLLSLTKPGSKFSNIVHITEPSRILSTSARMEMISNMWKLKKSLT
ncbi:hypothetical protein Tco_0434746 [Tanacetum coccineum]